MRAAEMKDGSPSHLALHLECGGNDAALDLQRVTNVILIQSAVVVPMNRDSAGAVQISRLTLVLRAT